jgi:hypothetical protein
MSPSPCTVEGGHLCEDRKLQCPLIGPQWTGLLYELRSSTPWSGQSLARSSRSTGSIPFHQWCDTLSRISSLCFGFSCKTLFALIGNRPCFQVYKKYIFRSHTSWLYMHACIYMKSQQDEECSKRSVICLQEVSREWSGENTCSCGAFSWIAVIHAYRKVHDDPFFQLILRTCCSYVIHVMLRPYTHSTWPHAKGAMRKSCTTTAWSLHGACIPTKVLCSWKHACIHACVYVWYILLKKFMNIRIKGHQHARKPCSGESYTHMHTHTHTHTYTHTHTHIHT